MSEFWPCFTLPPSEIAGGVVLLVVLFLIACAGLIALWVYHWVRRKIQSAWSGGDL